MAKKILELKQFLKGIIAAPSDADIPEDSPVFSKNIYVDTKWISAFQILGVGALLYVSVIVLNEFSKNFRKDCIK